MSKRIKAFKIGTYECMYVYRAEAIQNIYLEILEQAIALNKHTACIKMYYFE